MSEDSAHEKPPLLHEAIANTETKSDPVVIVGAQSVSSM